MPAHIVVVDAHSPASEQLAASVRKLEAREEIVSVVQTGDCFVVVTRRKPGRPAKETRVTAQAETR